MMTPNNFGMLSSRTGYDKYGDPVFGPAVKVPCAVITLTTDVEKSAIRADASASESNADEDVVVSMILFPVNVQIRNGSRFLIAGSDLRVLAVEPRFSVFGNQDHWECKFEAWPDEGDDDEG